MTGSYFLPTQKLKLCHDVDGTLVMNLDGQKVALASPKRTLPLSDPDRFIMLSDRDGNELGIVRDVAELEPSSRAVLQEALSRAYVIERITRILEVEKEPLSGQVRWRVEIASNERDAPSSGTASASGTVSSTLPSGESAQENSVDKILDKVKWFQLTKGIDAKAAMHITAEEREFRISGQEDVQTARYPHIYIVDTDGNRYEIPNCEALDIDSRRAAEQFF